MGGKAIELPHVILFDLMFDLACLILILRYIVETFVVLETPGGGGRPRPRNAARTSVGRAPKPAASAARGLSYSRGGQSQGTHAG